MTTTEAAKVIQLVAVETYCADGQPKMWKGQGCAGATMTIKGWKHFDCTFTLADGSRWKTSLAGFEPPSVEAVERSFNTRPRMCFSRVG